MQNYKLSCELHGHSQDIKAISAVKDVILTASRDKSVISWDIRNKQPYKCFKGHSNYVNSLAVVNHADFGDLILSGGSDKIVYGYSVEGMEEEPIITLVGHESNVCSIDVSNNGLIVTGSWDKTARVWKDFVCVATLKGHEQAVWAVKFYKSDIITASADKTIKIWRDGNCVRTMTGHKDCVRGLAIDHNGNLISCGNDGLILVWDISSGKVLRELSGHNSFIYSIAVCEGGELVSVGEDRSIKIWSDYECVQSIAYPALSIWCVYPLENGDFIVGGSDCIARVFTKSIERIGDEELIKEFDEKVSNTQLPSNMIGDVNKEKLQGKEGLAEGGNKIGQVKMIKNGNNVEAYQWDGNDWIKVGDVVDAVGSNRKQLFNGKEYDYVFDVDIADGVVLKLPFNANENPYMAAQKFIDDNDLSQSYLDQVADFIIKNTNGISFDSQNYSNDPLTGGSRYIPGPPNSYNSPTTVKKQFSASKELNFFESANLDGIKKKIQQFNSEFLHLTTNEENQLSEIYEMIEKKNASEFNQFELIYKFLALDASKIFPIIDLLRLLAYYNANIPTEIYEDVFDIANSSDINRMLSLRLIVNSFKGTLWTNFLPHAKKIICFSQSTSNNNLNQAISFTLLNYSIKGSVIHAPMLLDILKFIINTFQVNEDLFVNCLQSLGTLIVRRMVDRTVLNDINLSRINTTSKIQELISEINLL
ncbi:PFU-domain-containing protein [Rozella allomycis CSF55]|uniref:PFU-domain-containing protein n=1 Tax=Rozella allomycis (strain CSF55) TaxID=988480 RepID=A0A4V1IZF9_ROZAC|nr:PFU-domain-containing protein [Rozella allomycis CSF55]